MVSRMASDGGVVFYIIAIFSIFLSLVFLRRYYSQNILKASSLPCVVLFGFAT